MPFQLILKYQALQMEVYIRTRTFYMIKRKAGFIFKLEAILDNQHHQHIISWAQSGSSFLILDPSSFELSILTDYFRHKNMSSFIRQLNMYGFHKCKSVGYRSVLEFKHPLFTKDSPQHHHLIERKKSAQVGFDLANLMKKSDSASHQVFDHMEDHHANPPYISEELQIPQIESRFRLIDSQNTIRLTQKLISLCHVEWNELQDEKEDNLSIISSDRIISDRQKTSNIETLLFSEGSGILSQHF